MEILVAIFVFWLLSKLFGGKSKNKGERIYSISGNKFKCDSCKHDRFLDVYSNAFDGREADGREYVQYRYTGHCAKCGAFLNERSGIRYL